LSVGHLAWLRRADAYKNMPAHTHHATFAFALLLASPGLALAGDPTPEGSTKTLRTHLQLRFDGKRYAPGVSSAVDR